MNNLQLFLKSVKFYIVQSVNPSSPRFCILLEDIYQFWNLFRFCGYRQSAERGCKLFTNFRGQSLTNKFNAAPTSSGRVRKSKSAQNQTKNSTFDSKLKVLLIHLFTQGVFSLPSKGCILYQYMKFTVVEKEDQVKKIYQLV